jgi:hypothetical protein
VACLRAAGPWRIRVVAARAIVAGTDDGYRELLVGRR